jgi:hypothetical protein
VGGGTPAAGDTWHLPPLASPAGSMPPPSLAAGGRAGACRHPHWRQVAGQGHAATPTGGRWQGQGPCRHPHWRQGGMPPPHWATSPGWTEGGRAGDANGGRGLPAMPMAAGATCRLPRGCRHPQPVLFDKTFRKGSFLAIHSRRWSIRQKFARADVEGGGDVRTVTATVPRNHLQTLRRSVFGCWYRFGVFLQPCSYNADLSHVAQPVCSPVFLASESKNGNSLYYFLGFNIY